MKWCRNVNSLRIKYINIIDDIKNTCPVQSGSKPVGYIFNILKFSDPSMTDLLKAGYVIF